MPEGGFVFLKLCIFVDQDIRNVSEMLAHLTGPQMAGQETDS